MPRNHLEKEKSPYLLQHADNPVHWYPWGDAAFERATAEDKPIFLSVGYATCHWCHVMERESFENPEAAEHLNDAFVCIKVDREERPDVDALYMTACQMFNGNGGWPLTVLMTPDKQPFFAATYIPRNSGFGRVGLIDLCRSVKRIWETDRSKITHTVESLTPQLNKAFSFTADRGPEPEVLERAFNTIEKSYDPVAGGFGPAPKFPTPHRLQFLLRYYYRTGNENALSMVRHTLKAMRLGGIYDHVGFGFHRYSTDAKWHLPHFEKMLYDQAMMAVAYLETCQITGASADAAPAREIFEYVKREMTHAEGGFYSAQDADSEGEEGKFYVWSLDAFRQVLGAEEAGHWTGRFNMDALGNFREEATGRTTGANILYLSNGLSGGDTALAQRWEAAREKLFRARSHRIPPLKDDKILTDWNGMMITALALGARVLDSAAHAADAVSAARFILKNMVDGDGRLLHRYRDGEAAIPALADDYAFFIQGLLALHGATFDLEFLETAVSLQKRMMTDFWDHENGGFFLNAAQNNDLPARPKEVYDGATPSANSAALSNLLVLEGLTGDPQWRRSAESLVKTFSSPVTAHSQGFTALLMGLDRLFNGGNSVVLVSPDNLRMDAPMPHRLNHAFLPHTGVLVKTPHNAERLARIAPFTRHMVPLASRTTAYVCKGHMCTAPTADPDEMMQHLENQTG